MLYSTPTPDPFRKTKRKQNRRFSGAVTLPSHMSALRSQLIRWHFIENVKPKVRAKFIQTVVSLSTRFNKIRKTFLTHFFLLFCVSHSHAGFLIFNSSRFFFYRNDELPLHSFWQLKFLNAEFLLCFRKGKFCILNKLKVQPNGFGLTKFLRRPRQKERRNEKCLFGKERKKFSSIIIEQWT